MVADLEAPLRPVHAVVPGAILTRRFRPNWPSFLARGRLGIDDRAAFWVGQAAELREPILARGALTGALDGD